MGLESTIIFIDRSAFESENFFSGLKIKQLASFAKEGVIEIKITEVTQREIRKATNRRLKQL